MYRLYVYHHGHGTEISNNHVMSRKNPSVLSYLLVFLPPAEKPNLTPDQSRENKGTEFTGS